MTCPSCGHENRETARFCGVCAAPLVPVVTCPNCGTTNPPMQRFCDAGGAPLQVPDARSRASDPDTQHLTPET